MYASFLPTIYKVKSLTVLGWHQELFQAARVLTDGTKSVPERQNESAHERVCWVMWLTVYDLYMFAVQRKTVRLKWSALKDSGYMNADTCGLHVKFNLIHKSRFCNKAPNLHYHLLYCTWSGVGGCFVPVYTTNFILR